MMVRVWEYDVDPGCVAECESADGVDGDWAQLGAADTGDNGGSR